MSNVRPLHQTAPSRVELDNRCEAALDDLTPSYARMSATRKKYGLGENAHAVIVVLSPSAELGLAWASRTTFPEPQNETPEQTAARIDFTTTLALALVEAGTAYEMARDCELDDDAPAGDDARIVCSCKRVYTIDQWNALELVGYHFDDDEKDPHALELRNCASCASTRARRVEEHVALRAAIHEAHIAKLKLRATVSMLRDVQKATHNLTSALDELDRDTRRVR